MKKLEWKEVESILRQRLTSTKTILTFGTIGSLNLGHDVDIIIMKKPTVHASDFYKEVHSILDFLNSYLIRNYKRKIVRFSKFDHQEEVLKIANYKKGDLALQVMCYVSLPQFIDVWKSCVKRDDNFVQRVLENNYKLLYGDKKSLFSKEFNKPGKMDSFFMYMNDLDRTNSNYSDSFLLKTMNHSFRAFLRWANINKTVQAKNAKEVRLCFYKVADILEANS